MKTLYVVIAIAAALQAPTSGDMTESSSTGNLQALSGIWRPAKQCDHLLDPGLMSSGEVGFEISIDKQLGDSHRKAPAPNSYYDAYSAFLKKQDHEPVATGFIRFDYGTEGEFVISQKEGSLYVWYGVVILDNPRIFIGRGSEAHSAEILAIEWTSNCSESPSKPGRRFATVIYERVNRRATETSE